MSREPKTYTQVRLVEIRGVSYSEEPRARDDAWIPTEFAHVGRTLAIGGQLWTVAAVFSTRDADWVLANEREWRKIPTSDT